jgi:hypothetical protein
MNVPVWLLPSLVVCDRFVQRRGEAHREPAVDLPVDDHRVDDVAAVVDGHEAADLDLARALVDVDDADVRAEREREVRRVVVVDRLEAGLHPLRMVGVGGERDLLDRLEPIRRALDREPAVGPFEVVLVGLEQMRGELAALSRIFRDATAVAAPATGVERDAYVPRP